MIFYEDSQSKMEYYFGNVRENTDPLDFGDNGISFMFTISDILRNKYFTDEKYGEFKLMELTRLESEDKGYTTEMIPIPISKCRNDSAILKGVDHD